MDRVTIRDLRRLVESGVAPCVTIQLPTQAVGADRLEDAVRLKNLAQQAENELAANWMRVPQARDLMQKVRELPKDTVAWSQRGQGLALFVDPESFHQFRVSQPLPEFLHVGKRFHVKALLPVVDQAERYFVLVLSQNSTRLLEGTRHDVSEVEVPGLPARKDVALQLDGADRGEQVHSGGDFGRTKQAAVFHGQGGSPDARKDEIKLYFRQVNKALMPVLRREQLPLIVAGVDYLLPIFRGVCDYAAITDRQVSGNLDYTNHDEIHRRVWPVVEPLFEAPRRSAAARLQGMIGTGKASDDPRDVLMAAVEGRIDTLFVNPHEHQWGVFDEANNRVELHKSFEPGDDDLLEVAAVETLRRGGDVYSTEAAELPTQEHVAAVYRY